MRNELIYSAHEFLFTTLSNNPKDEFDNARIETRVALWTSTFFNEAYYFNSNYLVSSIICSSSSDVYSLIQ